MAQAPTKAKGVKLSKRQQKSHAGIDISFTIDNFVRGKVIGPDGKPMHMHGTASDIMRRGADGAWRYIIDNNQGTAVRHPG